MKRHLGLIALLALCSLALQGEAPAAKSAAPKTREFLFTYAATVTGLKPGQTAKIWLPVPPSHEDQDVKIAYKKLPGEEKIGTEKRYGNQILYVEARADDSGTVPLAVTYRVKRKEVLGDKNSDQVGKEEVELFLQADARVPIGGKSLVLLKGKELPTDQLRLGKALYDIVNDHMVYSKKGTGWGQGDADWACDSKYGNCTDFHSLFIALARSKKIPAKFEMGFPLPEQRGQGEVPGYHCWAKFKPAGRGWIPVDISEANRAREKNPEMVNYYFGNLTENRVAFSVGRDLTLVPPQVGPPLNFLIYPYVEVDGQPYAADKVQRKFSYQDVN